MGRFRQRMHDEYAHEFSTEERYNAAYKKVKKIKGFYSHLRIYVIINILIIVSTINNDFVGMGFNFNGNGLLDWHTYSTAFYWGIALSIHAFSVFGRDLFFSEDWEQKKIQEYMEKEAANTNKWE